MEANSYGASHIDNSIPRKEKDVGSFTLPCYINNVFFDNALAHLGARVSVMPLSTYLNLGLGELAHTKLIIELADRIVKYPKGIAENVLTIFVYPHAKIDVFKRKITLRIRDEKITFKSVKPTSSLIKRVYMISLRERMELDLEARLMGETLVLNRSIDPLNGDYIELNDLNKPLELRQNQVDDLMPTIKEGFELTHINFFPLLYVNVMSKKIHNSIMKDQLEYKGNNVVGALMNVPIFVETFSVVTDFAVLEDMNAYRDEGMGDVIAGEPFLREIGIKARRVLYKVVDIATCFVKVCKVWDDWEVDRYGNINLVIMKYLVKISKKACILELKRRNMKITDSDIQYVNSFDCPPDSYHPPHPTYETYSGDSCGNNSHFGHDCPPRFPLNYKPEQGYIQNYNSYPHDLPSFPQQYPCCEDCGVTHEPYQCQPKNHDYYHEQNSCCDSNSIGFDQFQPQQYTVNHPIFNAHHDLLGSQKKLNFTLTKVNEQMTSLTSMCELACQIVQKNLEKKQLEEEQAAKAQNWKLPVCYDDDDNEESSNSLEDNIISELPLYSAITPNEPVDSLSMGDEHLDTVPTTESDEFIKSCVENLVPNPSESEGENECDVPAGFTTFSNIDSLFDEFAGELTLLKSVLPGIDETDCHPEKETRFVKRLLYDNSSPRPPKEIVSDNSNANIESFSPSPIPNKDSNSHMEEIDLPFTLDDLMPSGIKDDDYDSGRDNPILEELLENYSLSLPANESYHFDIPSPYRPPAKPPDGNIGTLNIKMMGDVSDQKVPMSGLTITRILNQEKSPELLYHLGLEIFQPSAECPMIINGKNTPVLDVPLFHFYPP
nr:hypothetical protein [Tanacetum cinerariifolium]